jgi:putative membrane protein
MIGFIVRFLVVAAGLWIAQALLSGVSFASNTSLLITAAVLGLVNAILRPVLQLLALPITIVTLGLFAVVVNGAMVALVDLLIDGFHTASFWDDLGVALFVGLVGWAANLFGDDQRRRN